jgi:nanoRNase/pAp phosphatase (c-di-AMP/oligoRNAs hydrolase)
VDTVPDNAGAVEGVVFDLVIDHHKELCPPDFSGLFINFNAGSCCSTIYELMKLLDLSFKEQNDQDSKVATSLLVGIIVDTENLMSDDCTEFEFAAWAELFPFRNSVALRKIAQYDRPKFWIDTKARSLSSYLIEEGVGIVGMGVIPAKHRDILADMVQEMMSWEGVETAVAFAIVDGDRIEGCVRSVNASVSVPKLCKSLGGKHGCGGGKLGKGAYRVQLGGGGIDDEDGEEIKDKTWELHHEKEKRRIIRIIKT